eukprot:gene4706-5325_t
MLCSVLSSISYNDLLDFLKLIVLQKLDTLGKSENRRSNDRRTVTKLLHEAQIGEESSNKKDLNVHNSSPPIFEVSKKSVAVANERYDFEAIAAEDLEIGEKLGAGGFGVVYTVKYRARKFALKKMHRMSTKASKESYEAEASILHLKHPNIVRAHSMFTMDESSCILMEFVSKRTLQHVITDVECEKLDENRRLRFAFDIARGLSYAHGKGIAHLDVKPTNILITNNDSCKICDFGCSQSMENSDPERPSSPTKSNLTGTYAYRAPELFRGEFATPKCDIYSVGICLWQMLAREEKPYGSKNQHCVIFGVVAYNMRPTITNEMNCGARYRQIMEQCWDKDPLVRPSATEVSKALDMTLNLTFG